MYTDTAFVHDSYELMYTDTAFVHDSYELMYTNKAFVHNNLKNILSNRQTSGESASLPQYLGCNTVLDMRLRVTFLRRKTVSLQSNIAHRE
jgi:hypothetical protein